MTEADIVEVIWHLRRRDRQELFAYGMKFRDAIDAFMAPSVLSRSFAHHGSAVAVVAFHALTPSALSVSMMATGAWPSVAASVLRWGTRLARPALLARGYRRAECRTMEGHDDAVRFLEHLGFGRECCLPGYGADGSTFLQYSWRLNDHVSRKVTEDPRAATGTAHRIEG
jgi:hypothetical protein